MTGEKPGVRAVIFDMDGVLIDSEPLHLIATNRVLMPHAAQLSASDNQEYLGWTEEAFWQDLVRRFDLPNPAAHYGSARRAEFLSLLSDDVPLVDGLTPFLRQLRAMELPLAVASSSDKSVIARVLDAGHLSAFFDVVVSGDEVRRSKPDPEIFLTAAERLGVEPSSCVVFEDSPHGIHAALSAGMRCIRVVNETTRGLPAQGAHAEIETFVGVDFGRLSA